MYAELGYEPSALTVARHYADILTAFVIDHKDVEMQSEIGELGMQVLVTDTVMGNRDDRCRLAKEMIEYISKEV
jgi:LPPG:FO 2-phospho-L-lactate transferase